MPQTKPTGSEQRRTEDLFRLVVESAPDGILIVDDTGAITFINARVEQMFGYSRDELVGRSVEVLVPVRFQQAHQSERIGFQKAPRARPMGAGRELYAVRKDGTEFPVEIGLNKIETEQGIKVNRNVVDITDRKRS
ncbi:MAG: PAS domain S-box protein, partial [Nitrospiraceae bacterium]|nr:PAS domain S-box protein [Nitrospiraceae bacterium]